MSADCQVCLNGKFGRRFDGSLTKSTRSGALHVDTRGTMEVDSVHGHKYFLTIVEQQSRYVAVRSIKSKAQAADDVWRFLKYLEKRSGYTVRTLHNDAGTEFRSVIDELKSEGVHCRGKSHIHWN